MPVVDVAAAGPDELTFLDRRRLDVKLPGGWQLPGMEGGGGRGGMFRRPLTTRPWPPDSGPPAEASTISIQSAHGR